jgi:hypothetical protein
MTCLLLPPDTATHPSKQEILQAREVEISRGVVITVKSIDSVGNTASFTLNHSWQQPYRQFPISGHAKLHVNVCLPNCITRTSDLGGWSAKQVGLEALFDSVIVVLYHHRCRENAIIATVEKMQFWQNHLTESFKSLSNRADSHSKTGPGVPILNAERSEYVM